MIQYIRQHVSVKYRVITGLTIGLVFAALYVWLAHKHKALIMNQVLKQAQILHRQLVLTRQWVSDHGYVLVAASNGGRIAPGQAAPARPRQSLSSQAYTRITPAGLTRQLSDYAESNHLYAFSLANQNPKNPQNRPDAFETQALTFFREGRINSLSRVETAADGHRYFRYAAPLVVQKSCMTCHQHPGFIAGGIGGCISVKIPFDETHRAIRSEHLSLFGAMVGLTLSVMLILFFLAQKLIFRRIRDIRQFTRHMHTQTTADIDTDGGDELKAFKQLCYTMDETLRHKHGELAAQITEATRELEKTNQDLVNLNQVKSDFLADISHELRTPLTSIKGAVDFLCRKAACEDRAHLEIIRKNTALLIRTVVDFLDYSRIESGNMELERGRIQLPPLVREVVAAQASDAALKEITINVSTETGLRAWADRHRIYQVLANLLNNAIKFSPPGSSIAVTLDKRDRMAQISVMDRGPGVPEQYQQAIFKKFYQLRGKKAQQAMHRGSSGIGLAICKGLVEAHGGRIWVSARPNGGSNFCFMLPLTPGGDTL